MKTELKLEVGKSYRNRCGCIVKIISNDGTPVRQFKGNDDRHFFPNGKLFFGSKHDFDLIEEVDPEKTGTLTDIVASEDTIETQRHQSRPYYPTRLEYMVAAALSSLRDPHPETVVRYAIKIINEIDKHQPK